jgi:hypothetical protein
MRLQHQAPLGQHLHSPFGVGLNGSVGYDALHESLIASEKLDEEAHLSVLLPLCQGLDAERAADRPRLEAVLRDPDPILREDVALRQAPKDGVNERVLLRLVLLAHPTPILCRLLGGRLLWGLGRLRLDLRHLRPL